MVRWKEFENLHLLGQKQTNKKKRKRAFFPLRLQLQESQTEKKKRMIGFVLGAS